MLYIFSTIILFILILLLPKVEGKINLIKAAIIEVICFFAYNAAVCYFFSFVGIPITLQSLTIFNFIIGLIFCIVIFKKKEFQKYYINRNDVLITLILIFTTTIVAAYSSRNLTRIKYICMDGVEHYKAAREFSESTYLFNKDVENKFTTPGGFMPMGYVNVGILFKVFKPYIGVINLYKIYIIFEAVILFLTGVVFYYCISLKIKTKNQFLVGIIFSIIYVLGYPLNAFISGFHYLIVGILYFSSIVYTMIKIIPNDNIKFVYKVVITALLNIGLIFSYCLFCPPIYLAEFIYIIYLFKNDKKKIITFVFISLIITGLIGCDITLYDMLKNYGISAIGFEGWLYKNNWSNIIIFLPFTIYYLICLLKEKEKNKVFEKIIYICYLLFFVVMYIGMKTKLISEYYFYKNYFIIWFLTLYTYVRALIKLIEKNNITKYIVNFFTTFYVFFLIVSCMIFNVFIIVEGKYSENLTTIMHIYNFNYTNIKIDAAFLTKDEIQLLEMLDKTLQKNWNEETLLIGKPSQVKWLKSLTGYDENKSSDIYDSVSQWNQGKYKYLILFEKRDIYELIKDKINLSNIDLLFKNDAGKIYVRNGE